MTKLQELAGQLADLYKVRKNLQVNIDHTSAEIEARKLDLTPAEGWPGKNEEQRSIAREKAFAGDRDLCAMNLALSGLRDDLAGFEADIEGLQVVASAERWAVREKLADALLARGVEASDDQDPEAPEFSDVEDDASGYVDFSEFKPATPNLTPTYSMLLPETPEAEDVPWHQHQG